jgi:uncharacterized protein (TIGR02996 family)
MGIYYSDHLECMGYSQRIDGVRLPGLARHLANSELIDDETPSELVLLKEALFSQPVDAFRHETAFLDELRSRPDDEATWMAYSDWLSERGGPSAGIEVLRRAMEAVAAEGVRSGWKHDPSRSRIHAEEHLAQMCIHTLEQQLARGVRNHWDQWYFFDDLWASAHPALANGLLAYGLRWDALSSWRSKPLEE